MEYGASVLRVVDGRTIQVDKISAKCSAIVALRKQVLEEVIVHSDLMKPQEIMKEKMANLDPNTVAVKAKPKENSEQVN